MLAAEIRPAISEYLRGDRWGFLHSYEPFKSEQRWPAMVFHGGSCQQLNTRNVVVNSTALREIPDAHGSLPLRRNRVLLSGISRFAEKM